VGGHTVADAAGRPYVYGALSPQWFRSGAHAPFAAPPSTPKWMRRIAWWLTELGCNQMFGPMVNRARVGAGLHATRSMVDHLLGDRPLLAFDEAFAPLPPDVDAAVVRSGAWFLPPVGELDDGLEAFLRAGPPPVYVGFGSMPDRNAAATTQVVLAAVERAGVRAVLSSGWARLGLPDLPPQVLVIGPTEHARLFPRCELIVHHGGAGTTHAAVRAGVPQLVVPHAFDQSGWGTTTLGAGVALESIPRAKLTVDRLAGAITRARSDPGLRERARALAQRIAGDGAALAVRHLETLVGAAQAAEEVRARAG
jgi:vancomycin aglycone glucosyltransferase